MTIEWLFVGIKAVKTRVDRAALQSLGEAFAARLQVPFNCPSASLLMALHDNSACFPVCLGAAALHQCLHALLP